MGSSNRFRIAMTDATTSENMTAVETLSMSTASNAI